LLVAVHREQSSTTLIAVKPIMRSLPINGQRSLGLPGKLGVHDPA
jgi:hypothetical protein